MLATKNNTDKKKDTNIGTKRTENSHAQHIQFDTEKNSKSRKPSNTD